MNTEDSKIERETRKQLAEFELELLQQIRQTVKDGKIPDVGLVALLGKISDLKLTETYTHKFSDAVARKIAPLLPPSAMPGSLIQKFRGLQSSLERQEKKDKRKSSTPKPKSWDEYLKAQARGENP